MESVTLGVLASIGIGMVGGIAHLLVDAKDWGDVVKFPSLKTAILGAIVGGLYYLIRQEWNFPDGVMTFISGYMGVDFILGLIEQGKKIIAKKGIKEE